MQRWPNRGRKQQKKGKRQLSAGPLDAAADGLGCVWRLVGQREGAGKGVTWRKVRGEEGQALDQHDLKPGLSH